MSNSNDGIRELLRAFASNTRIGHTRDGSRGARLGARTGHVPAGTSECRPHPRVHFSARSSGLLLGVPALWPKLVHCIHRLLLPRDRRPQRTRQYPQRAHRSYIHFKS